MSAALPPVPARVRATLLVGSCFTLLAGATLAPALPGMTKAFAAVPNAAFLSKMVLATSSLFVAIGAPIAGRLIDRFGRRGLLLAAMFLTALAGTIGFVLADFPSLLVSRAALGLGAAGVATACTTLIGDLFAGERREYFLGFQAAFMKLGGVVFLLLGGLLAGYNWRYPFLLYLLALPIFLLALVSLPAGAAAPAVATALGRPGWRALPGPILALLSAVSLIATAAFYLIPTVLPFLLASRLDASPRLIGVIIATSTLFSMATAAAFGRLRKRASFPLLFALFMVFEAVGFAVIAASSTTAHFFIGAILAGLGLGLQIPTTAAWLLSRTPEPVRGTAIGVLTSAIFLGQFCGPLLSQPLVARFGEASAFAAAAAILGLGGIIFLGQALFARKPDIAMPGVAS